MTTRIRAKKYRSRRGGELSVTAVSDAQAGAAEGTDAGAQTEPGMHRENTGPDASTATAATDDGTDGGAKSRDMAPGKAATKDQAYAGEVSDAAEVSAEEAIETIRKEGLTGRQLRMARRIAMRHNISATSDYDAVFQLRQRGIDPLHRANMLELVIADKSDDPATKLPQTVPSTGKNLPSPHFAAEGDRADAVLRIQRDIARRRRRRMVGLVARLVMFVMLPTLLAGYYFSLVATPLYATKSEFVIQQADIGSASGGLGGLFSGTQLATSQDSLTVQSFLKSRAALQRLDQDHGFRAHFSQEFIDPISRLDPGATNEDAYRLFNRMIKIAFDPTEGILRMEVIATDPATSAVFSSALIGYAEEVVDNLSRRLREDQMAGARSSFEDAETKMRAAQSNVINLQERYDVISTEVEVSILSQQISALENQLIQERLSVAELRANQRPNDALLTAANNRIETLEDAISELRSNLTRGGENGESLARIGSELAIAQADLETRNFMMQTALQALETARIKADSQTRYLATGVPPIAPDEATYPRAFENTILALLIFSGIYLMISLTVSILREQVTS